ncbi:MAG TPA: dTDP-4-dehydrorhamnose 3,5-epimerase [Planctomycetaceae bacterium]|nr:dTDP-4-dehydrorhamnose 3,5-epimerase [Planctomycetaceae bacterium]
MEIQRFDIPGPVLIRPRVFEDARGFFLETYQKQRYEQAGIVGEFVQDNWSRSRRGTLRGLHYQIRQSQGKLVFVLRGEIFDVAVDLRRGSPGFGRWVGVHLRAEERHQFYIPPGFAHGFYVLSDVADVFYKCTDYYAPQHERTLLWNDADVGIRWPLEGAPILSEKDQRGTPLSQAEVFESL